MFLLFLVFIRIRVIQIELEINNSSSSKIANYYFILTKEVFSSKNQYTPVLNEGIPINHAPFLCYKVVNHMIEGKYNSCEVLTYYKGSRNFNERLLTGLF